MKTLELTSCVKKLVFVSKKYFDKNLKFILFVLLPIVTSSDFDAREIVSRNNCY